MARQSKRTDGRALLLCASDYPDDGGVSAPGQGWRGGAGCRRRLAGVRACCEKIEMYVPSFRTFRPRHAPRFTPVFLPPTRMVHFL